MTKEEFKKYGLPESPGVYFFLDKKSPIQKLPAKSRVLYIGKATSLKDRVGSYFSKDLLKTRGVRIESMVENAKDIFYLTANSVLEAILLEAKYIKEFQPFFNVKAKDNTSYSYVIFTKEDYPRVLIKRGRDLEKNLTLEWTKKFGPFTSKAELGEVMKFVRKLFPYRDKCKLGEKRPCFNYQLGLCPGTCIQAISKKDYLKNLRKIENILAGNIEKLLKDLTKEMLSLAKEQKFEAATKIRNQIQLFNSLKDIAFIKKADLVSAQAQARIESYDISHLSGKNRVGVMVVMEQGEFNKNEYRKFKLREGLNDDLGGLSEVLERRFQHREWRFPDFLVIDGGKTHLNFIARLLTKILKKEDLEKIKLFSVVKDERHKARAVLSLEPVDKSQKSELENQIILINEETHRFAIKYHKRLRNKLNYD